MMTPSAHEAQALRAAQTECDNVRFNQDSYYAQTGLGDHRLSLQTAEESRKGSEIRARGLRALVFTIPSGSDAVLCSDMVCSLAEFCNSHRGRFSSLTMVSMWIFRSV